MKLDNLEMGDSDDSKGVKRMREVFEMYNNNMENSYLKEQETLRHTKKVREEELAKRLQDFKNNRDNLMKRFYTVYKKLTPNSQRRYINLYNEQIDFEYKEDIVKKYEKIITDKQKDTLLLSKVTNLYNKLNGSVKTRFKLRFENMKDYESRLKVYNFYNEKYIEFCKFRNSEFIRIQKLFEELINKIENPRLKKYFMNEYSSTNVYEHKKYILENMKHFIENKEYSDSDDLSEEKLIAPEA